MLVGNSGSAKTTIFNDKLAQLPDELLAMLFSPLFASIPTISSGPALIMVGVFMLEGVKDIVRFRENVVQLPYTRVARRSPYVVATASLAGF